MQGEIKTQSANDDATAPILPDEDETDTTGSEVETSKDSTEKPIDDEETQEEETLTAKEDKGEAGETQAKPVKPPLSDIADVPGDDEPMG